MRTRVVLRDDFVLVDSAITVLLDQPGFDDDALRGRIHEIRLALSDSRHSPVLPAMYKAVRKWSPEVESESGVQQWRSEVRNSPRQFSRACCTADNNWIFSTGFCR